MAVNSGIEWTQSTWNPVTGCSEISPGCKNCYAKRMALRLKAMGMPAYRNGFCVTCHPNMLNVPLHWKKPQLVFVNSMSDLFHAKVPMDFISSVFDVMNRTSHIYQVLTKRAERLAELSGLFVWAKDIWAGVTVEAIDYKYRIDLIAADKCGSQIFILGALAGRYRHIGFDGYRLGHRGRRIGTWCQSNGGGLGQKYQRAMHRAKSSVLL